MTTDKIIDTTCEVFGITREELMGRSRTSIISDARCIAIELICVNESHYIREVAGLFNRSRTTLIASRLKFSRIYGFDKLFTSKYNDVINKLN